MTMPQELHRLQQEILASQRVDTPALETLRQHLYADGRIDRREADFLAELHKRVQRPHSPAFDHFVYQAIKDHILTDGKVDAEEAAWLRQMLYADGKIDDHEKKFLRELRGEAKQVSPEFEALCDECLK